MVSTSTTRYKIPRVMITHSGVHHADEVFAYGLLKLINPGIDLIRTSQITDQYREMEKIGQAIIVDIGGGEFDHHTDETVEYRNPEKMLNPYASFGKVLRKFWPELLENEEEYRCWTLLWLFPSTIPIARAVCGTASTTTFLTPSVVSIPTWEMNSDDNARLVAFKTAATFASEIIRNNIAKVKAIKHSQDITEKAIDEMDTQYHFIVLDRYVNYSATVNQNQDKDIFWVIYPSLRGGWCIYSVIFHGSNIDLISDQIKAEMEQDPNVTFIHPARFIATFTTKEAAIEWGQRISMDFDMDMERVKAWSDLYDSVMSKEI